jgi:hypothetical protein
LEHGSAQLPANPHIPVILLHDLLGHDHQKRSPIKDHQPPNIESRGDEAVVLFCLEAEVIFQKLIGSLNNKAQNNLSAAQALCGKLSQPSAACKRNLSDNAY